MVRVQRQFLCVPPRRGSDRRDWPLEPPVALVGISGHCGGGCPARLGEDQGPNNATSGTPFEANTACAQQNAGLASTGRAVLDVLLRRRAHVGDASRKTSRGAPSESASMSPLPATMEAAGARAARSQPFPLPTKRPRCSGDAGPPRTRRPEMKSHPPDRHIFSRTRDPSRYETDGQAGSPPPQCLPHYDILGRRGPEGRG